MRALGWLVFWAFVCAMALWAYREDPFKSGLCAFDSVCIFMAITHGDRD